ncbi:MAG: CRTAC1 family protein [Pseudomonadota bacterium]
MPEQCINGHFGPHKVHPGWRLSRVLARVGLGLLLTSSASAEKPSPLFENVAPVLGLSFSQTDISSLGWTDFNGDGWYDLWLSGHQMDSRFFRSRLYLNRQGKGFDNVWPNLHTAPFETDAHGTYWVDFDNDGDQDLSVVAGGGVGRNDTGSPSMLFEQRDGKLYDRGGALGLAQPMDRGRIGLWYDEDGDGRLDVFVTNGRRPDTAEGGNRLWRWREGEFVANLPTGERLQQQGSWQLLLAPQAPPRSAALPLRIGDHFAGAALAPFPRRIVQADLDGDGELDHLVYQLARLAAGSCFVQGRDGSVLAYLPPGADRVIRFRSENPVRLNTRDIPELNTVLGANQAPEPYASIILSAMDTRFHASPARAARNPGGMAIHYDPASLEWHLEVQQKAGQENALQFLLTPLAGDADIEALGNVCTVRGAPAPYLATDQGKVPLQIEGLNEALLAQSLLPGDFDNDGDVDLYALRATPLTDLPDLLLNNDGHGRFSARQVDAAWDYEAPGLHVREILPGSLAAIADYDNNGALDLFLGSRHYYGRQDESRLLPGVPARLLRNRGQPGNWLQISLEGSTSNRDAIGAEVRIRTAGGEQIRLHSGGIDSLNQHWQVLHFGLGEATLAQHIEVRWPSGQRTALRNIKAGSRLHLVEPGPSGE